MVTKTMGSRLCATTDELHDQSNRDTVSNAQAGPWDPASAPRQKADDLHGAPRRAHNGHVNDLVQEQGQTFRERKEFLTELQLWKPLSPPRRHLRNLHVPNNRAVTTLSRRTGKSCGTTNSLDHGTSLCTTTWKSARPAQQGNRPPYPRTLGTLHGHTDHGDEPLCHERNVDDLQDSSALHNCPSGPYHPKCRASWA